MAAIDGRFSAFNFCDPFDHILPIADGTVDAVDRQHLWGMYSEIAAGVAVPADPDIDMLHHGVVQSLILNIARDMDDWNSI